MKVFISIVNNDMYIFFKYNLDTALDNTECLKEHLFLLMKNFFM